MLKTIGRIEETTFQTAFASVIMAKSRGRGRSKGTTSTKREKKSSRPIFEQPILKNITTRVLSIVPPTEPITSPKLIHLNPQAPHPAHRVYTIDNFLTHEECRSWIQDGESRGFTRAFHPASSEFAHRDCGRVSWDDSRANHALWTRLNLLVKMGACDSYLDGRKKKTAVNVTRKIRIYKYEVGQWFGKHVDVSNEETDGKMGSVTGATVLIYLSGDEDGLVGGETVFYDGKEVVRVKPERGKLLIHAHGDDCLEHEAKLVTAGIKYVMRSDIVYR